MWYFYFGDWYKALIPFLSFWSWRIKTVLWSNKNRGVIRALSQTRCCALKWNSSGHLSPAPYLGLLERSVHVAWSHWLCYCTLRVISGVTKSSVLTVHIARCPKLSNAPYSFGKLFPGPREGGCSAGGKGLATCCSYRDSWGNYISWRGRKS